MPVEQPTISFSCLLKKHKRYVFLTAYFILFLLTCLAHATEDIGGEYNFHCFSKDGKYAIVYNSDYGDVQVLKHGEEKPVETISEQSQFIYYDKHGFENVRIPSSIIKKYNCFDKGIISKISPSKKHELVIKAKKVGQGFTYFSDEGMKSEGPWLGYFYDLQIFLKIQNTLQLVKEFPFTPSIDDVNVRTELNTAWSKSGKSFLIFGFLYTMWPNGGYYKPFVFFASVK